MRITLNCFDPHISPHPLSPNRSQFLDSSWDLVRSEFNELRGALSYAELATYIVDAGQRCVTSTDLLTEVRAEPSAVDFFFSDIRGFDLEILHIFFALPGFAPAALVFEWAHLSERVSGLLMHWLTAHGWVVHQCTYHDVVAINVGYSASSWRRAFPTHSA